MGLGAAALEPLTEDNWDPGDPADKLLLSVFCAQAFYSRARNWMFTFSLKKLLHLLGQPEAKSMAIQGATKWSTGCPKQTKRSPKSAQREKKPKDGQGGATNHKTILKLF